jgi:cell division protein FtsQ
VLASYLTFRPQLATVGQDLMAISLSERRAWQIRLANGALLELGRAEAAVRLARFVKAYPLVPALQLASARVDMRYQSGLAVKEAPDSAAKPTKKTTAKS